MDSEQNHSSRLNRIRFSPRSGSVQGETVRGLIYNPYYVVNFILAGVTIWALPQTWDFTRRLTWSKIAWCILLFFIALTALTTQSYNPFIYFIF